MSQGIICSPSLNSLLLSAVAPLTTMESVVGAVLFLYLVCALTRLYHLSAGSNVLL